MWTWNERHWHNRHNLRHLYFGLSAMPVLLGSVLFSLRNILMIFNLCLRVRRRSCSSFSSRSEIYKQKEYFQFKRFSSLAKVFEIRPYILSNFLTPSPAPPLHSSPPSLYPNPIPHSHQCSFLNSFISQKMTSKCWLKYKNSLTSLSMFVDLANSSCLMLWASCIWACIFWSLVFCW